MKRQHMEWEKIFAKYLLNIQNIQTAHTTQKQQKKPKQPNRKMGIRLKQTFFQRHTDGQQTH